MSIAPILYEVNTRVWLRELSEQAGQPLRLADIPDSEIDRWKNLGFTHIWLMGVWQVGPLARAVALQQWREKWHAEFPVSVESDVDGSPYAIQDYAVDTRLGEPLGLLMLKERLSRAGLKLILDFVPNHFGLDSPEPRRYPARFVQAASPVPGTIEMDTRLGKRFIAHGRDPWFPPWNDTVQIDYRVRETHEAMSALAQTVSMYGDGLRCDMAMLVLPEVFQQTWKDFPSLGARQTPAVFWKEAIPKIRQLQPQVDLIAEVYWDLEERLQDIGFDYTWNKRVTDYLMRRQDVELIQFLRERTPVFLRHSVHFLENHDEARASALLPLERHKAAAALTLFLPGMTLLPNGQLEGRKIFSPIQMSRRPEEAPDVEIKSFYETLLLTLQTTHVRRGQPSLHFSPDPNAAALAVCWTARHRETDCALVNLSAAETRFTLPDISSALSDSAILYTSNREKVLRQSGDGALILPPESAHIIRLPAS